VQSEGGWLASRVKFLFSRLGFQQICIANVDVCVCDDDGGGGGGFMRARTNRESIVWIRFRYSLSGDYASMSMATMRSPAEHVSPAMTAQCFKVPDTGEDTVVSIFMALSTTRGSPALIF
jgi:hypothetical protein